MEYIITPEKCAEHLAGAVRFKTLYKRDESQVDWDQFFGLHQYLKETYPLIHEKLDLEIVGKAGLLYHWKGTGKAGKKALYFMAHQDVVPEGDLKVWDFPPYEGHIADGYVWGRGACDCKSTIIAPMEAIEHLLSIDYTPNFDVFLAFGYNEEHGGLNEKSAAYMLAQRVEQLGYEVEAVFDEGSGISIDPLLGPDNPMCAFVLGEKGYGDYRISKKDAGGHSARPRKHQAMWYLAQAINAIEDHPFPYKLIDGVDLKFKTIAPYYKGKNDKLYEIYSDLAGHWDEVCKMADEDPAFGPYFHTTSTVTMAHGADAGNIIPEYAWINVNCRILPGETLESTREYLQSIVPEGMEVELSNGHQPSPISEFDSEVRDLVVAISSDRTGKQCIPIPDMALGGTDARYTYNLCNHVYRFAPFIRLPEDRQNGAHTAFEIMSIKQLYEGTSHYIELFKRYGEDEKYSK